MTCLSAAFNVAAAALSLIGGAMATAGAWIAPDPTFLTKLAAVALTVATVGAAAWLIAALIEFINCGKRAGLPAEEIEKLEKELKELEKKVRELEGH